MVICFQLGLGLHGHVLPARARAIGLHGFQLGLGLGLHGHVLPARARKRKQVNKKKNYS